MATPLTTAYRPWIDEADCRLDEFRAEVTRDTDLADYPHAVDVREQRPRLLGGDRRDRRPAGAAGRADPCAGRRARRGRASRALRRRRRRSRQRGVLRDHRGAAGGGRPRRATTSASPAPTTASGTPRRSWPCMPRGVRRLLRQRHARRGLRRPGWARATRSPRRSTSSIPVAASRFRTATTTSASSRRTHLAAYPAHLHRMSPVLTLQGAVAHCDMPVESGPTMLLPLLAAIRRRLHRVQPARVRRLLRRAPRPGAAGQGRRGVLQPGAVSRCGVERFGRHPADRQPAADLVAVRSRDGGAGPHRDGAGGLSGTARDEGRRAARSANCSTPWSRPPRATRSPPTSTATSRSAAWPRPARSTPCWPRWPTTSPQNNSTSRCATKTNGEIHDHPRRNRTGPHRRLPHRNPVSGLDGVDGLVDHRRAARRRCRGRRQTRCQAGRFGRGAAVVRRRRRRGRGRDAGARRADAGRRRARICRRSARSPSPRPPRRAPGSPR